MKAGVACDPISDTCALNLFPIVTLDVGGQAVLAQVPLSGRYLLLSPVFYAEMTDLCKTIVPLAAYLLKVSLVHSLFKHVSRAQFNYYIAELAFYCSLMFSQFIDVKRKVSKQQFHPPQSGLGLEY